VAQTSYCRHCPSCEADVPVERRFPGIAFFLLALIAVSLLVTVLCFPRLIFLFIFLPFGLRLWGRAEYCSVCGKRIP
jgi:hypothetical protein